MSSRFSAVLLAGGKSRRLGRDKALLEVAGEALWRRQVRLLESLAPEKIFIAGPLRQPGCETIADAQTNCGPLAGLVAALRVCTTPLLLALAVDLPRMTASCLRETLALCEHDRGVVPMTEQLEPLAAVYPIAALALAEEQLRSGQYSLQPFVRRCLECELMRPRQIGPGDPEAFFNLNTPADAERVLDLA